MKMNKTLLAFMAAAAIHPAWSADAPAGQPAAAPTQEQMVEQFRSDLLASRADLMAKGLKLNAEQAAKFWPLFEQFQKEQSAVVDAQLAAIQKYAGSFANLSEADALSYINSTLERDDKMHQLRVSWLKKFQTVVPVKVAARAIQLDRRMGQVTQVRLSTQLPLIQ